MENINYHMRYYLKEHKNKNIKHKLVSYKKEINKEKWILTHEGLYKNVNNDLLKFKVKFNNYPIQQNKFLISSNFDWMKTDISYNIPILHKIIDIDIIKYKLHPKSNTTFIIEQINSELSDYYFIGNKDIDNYSFNEDINSFLSILK